MKAKVKLAQTDKAVARLVTFQLNAFFHRQRKILLLVKWWESINITNNNNIRVLCILINVLSVMERTLNEYV